MKDLYSIALKKSPHNKEGIKKILAYYVSLYFDNKSYLKNIELLTIFNNNSKTQIYSLINTNQFIRKDVISLLVSCLSPEIKEYFYHKDKLYKMDNTNYIKLYQLLFDLLFEFKQYDVILWFFFQVPNYLDYNIDGYRKVYNYMIDYADLKFKKLPDRLYTYEEFMKVSKGSTYYYNLVYHGESNKELISKWNNLLYNTIIKDTQLLKYKKRKNSKIKICFLTDKFKCHSSVFRDRIGIIYNLDETKYDVYIAFTDNNGKLSNKNFNSSMHPIILNYLKNFNEKNKIIYLSSKDVLYNINLLKNYNFDILFYPDIGMKQMQTLLANNRICELQITTWGHSDTSGSDYIDYYISSLYYENNSYVKNNYSEKIILLNSLSTYYYNPLNQAFDFFNLRKNIYDNLNNINIHKFIQKKIILCCMHSFYKINEEYELMLSRIMNILHSSGYNVFIYFSNSIPFNNNHKKRIINIIGEKFKDNLIWQPNLNYNQWLVKLSECHLLLDSFPFGSCNTSFESIALNIPVITMPLKTINSRFTYGFYKYMNLVDKDKLIASSTADYIEKVVELIKNKGLYSKIVKQLFMLKNKLFEDVKSVNDYNKVFELLVNKKKSI